MKAEVREQFVAALRSGEYRQGFGRLRLQLPTGMRHCAGGVLCDLAVKEGVVALSPDGVGIEGHYASIPAEVQLWAGISPQQAAQLIGWNDISRLGFPEIAARVAVEW